MIKTLTLTLFRKWKREQNIKNFTLLLIFIISPVSAQIAVRDSINISINLNQPAKRIVSLSPNLTEIVYEVGAGKQLIARDSCSDFPNQVLKLPVVGSYYKINFEKIVKLRADLVLMEQAAFTQKETQLLQAFGIQVYVNHADSIKSIPKTMLDIAKLSGHEELGQLVAKNFSKKIAGLTAKRKLNVSVFYELWNAPLLSVNNQTLIGEVLLFCGGRNIVASLKSQTPELSRETVIKADPEIIITSVADSFWQEFKTLKAVKNHRIYFVSPMMVERTGPRVLQGIEEVCRILQNQPSYVPVPESNKYSGTGT